MKNDLDSCETDEGEKLSDPMASSREVWDIHRAARPKRG